MVERKSKLPTVVPSYGTGYHRMIARLGVDNAETLRLQVLNEQKAALDRAHVDAQEKRNRETYKDYPQPQQSKRRKK